MKSKTFYYESFSDDFAVTQNLHSDIVDEKYKYESKNPFYHIFAFIVYQIIVKPLAWVILKVWFGYRIKNKKVLRKCKNKGYFIYGNHTNYLPDAFTPNILRCRKNYIIVTSQTTSIKGIKLLVKALGATPLGDTYQAKKNLFRFMKGRIEKKQSITIYPEAHIWPYYTNVRPFDSVNIKYQLLLNAPCYTLSYCYSKRKMIKRPKLTVYVDGPFYPNNELDSKERLEDLTNLIYNKMKERINMYSTYSIHKYVRKESENETREQA